MRTRRLIPFSLLLGLVLAIALIGQGSQVTVASPGAVTVREPAFGLPHIYADTDLEFARENGREVAKDRLGQLILMGRVGRGTLYQAFGALDPSTFYDDLAVRTEGYTSSELNNMFAKFPAADQALIWAYCDGVNDTIDAIYAGTLPQPLEVTVFRNLLGLGNDLFGNATNISDQADPNYKAPGGADPQHPNGGFQFTPEMATAIAVLQIRSFGDESFDEASRLDELNSLLDKLPATGDEIWDDLNFLNDPLAPVTVPDPTTPGFGGPLAKHVVPEESPVTYATDFPHYDYEAALEPVREREAQREAFARSLGAWPAMGSYAWIIDGNRSDTDNPWIGGFPQMGIQVPSIMHFVENRSAEGADHRIGAIGMEITGGPFVIIGHTDTVGWTSTTAQLKVNDFYLDKLILEKTDALRYNDEGTSTPMSQRTDLIKGDDPPTSVLVWRTHERTGNGGSRTVQAFQGEVAGTVGSATDTSLTDTDAFSGDDFSGGYVAIVGGKGAGQMRPILSSTDHTLTLDDPDDAWTTIPDDTSEYVAVTSGNDIVVISRERVFWLEETTSLLGWSLFQRADSILDIRSATRLMPSTHNFYAVDNLAFNGIGTDLGPEIGNIGYWSGGFSRVRQGVSPTDTRLPMDGTVASELVVVGGTVDSAAAKTLTDAGAFSGKDFSPPPYNYRMDNPTEKGSEYIVSITGGAGYKQTRRIASNTANTLTLEEDWGVAPSPGDLFEVYEIVAMPEAINPSQGYTGNWNNKAATADDGLGFGREYRSTFVVERVAADSDWSRAEQRQLNKDVAGLDSIGKLGRYLIPRLREAVDGVGNGGNDDVDTVLAALEAHNGSPEFGRYFIDPVTETTTAGEMDFLVELIDDLASDIYGDEFSGTDVGTPTGLAALNLVQHAIDSAAGTPAGRYAQAYSGDYFNGTDWRVAVRDTFSATIVELGGIPSDPPRPEETYVHPLDALPGLELEWEPTLLGNRGTWEQIIEAGPVVLGEGILPLGQSGFISSGGVPDPHFDSLHSIWAEWRFVPMLHIAEDLATDPDGDVDNDGVLDGFEKWYFGSNSPLPTDDADGDGASLLDEFLNGLDPTEADTDVDGMPDGFELANACLNQPQARDSTDDADTDGLDNLGEYTAGTDPCDDDTDNDTVLDGADDDPLDEFVCQDVDADTCDDCAVLGQPDVSNDGLDTDSDGDCNAGDPDDDNDTVLDGADTDPLDKFVCQDVDADTCDDCSVLGQPDTSDDGPDNEPDGLCDAGDPDDDNDTVLDGDDNCPMVANLGQTNSDADSHGDACDNCPNTDNENQANGDSDSYGNACDNCPSDTNEDQANDDGDDWGDACDYCATTATLWYTPAGDDDCDGFTTVVEGVVGTDPADACPDWNGSQCPGPTCCPGPACDGDDVWPVDLNVNTEANVLDILWFKPVLGGAYDARYDFNGDSSVNVLDVLLYKPFVGTSCTP